MEKRKDFVGMDATVHRLAKSECRLVKGSAFENILAHLITTDTERRKNAISI